MEYMEKLKEMLCNELREMSDYKSLSVADTEAIKNMLSAIKNIYKIEDYKEFGYSEHDPYYDNGSSYARRGTHYVRGHYSRDNDRNRSEHYDRRYSRDEAKDRMMSQLGEMMEGADPNERESLKKAMREIERAQTGEQL